MASVRSTYGFVSSGADLGDRSGILSTSLGSIFAYPLSAYACSGYPMPSGARPVHSVRLVTEDGEELSLSPGPFAEYGSAAYDASGASPEFSAAFSSAAARYKCAVATDGRIDDLWLLFDTSVPSEMVDFVAHMPSMWRVRRGETDSASKIALSLSDSARTKIFETGAEAYRYFFASYPPEDGSSPNSSCCFVAETSAWYGDPQDDGPARASGRQAAIGSVQHGLTGITALGGTPAHAGKLVRLGPDGLFDESVLPASYQGFASALAKERDARIAADSALSGRIDGKQDELSFDDEPTEGSTNPVTSGGVYSAIEESVSKVYRFKGSVDSYGDLPSEGNSVGDVWNVKSDDMNYAWADDSNDGHWDPLGPTLSGYATKEEVRFEAGAGTDSAVQKQSSDVVIGLPIGPNSSVSTNSVAEGAGNVAGLRGYRYTDTGTVGNSLTFSVEPDGWAVGDVVSVINKSKYPDAGVIASIDGKTVTFESELSIGATFVEESDFDSKCAYVSAKPDKGDVDLGAGAHAEGVRTRAVNTVAHAEGRDTEAIGQYSHAEGRGTSAQYIAHAEGHGSVASGMTSHAEGNSTTASGDNSHSEGTNTAASGVNAHSENYGTAANGANSHAEGAQSATGGNAKPAPVTNFTNTGYAAHAEGNGTWATGSSSHAEGYSTVASALAAHAEGNQTVASGQNSHASGLKSIAEGYASTAMGRSAYAMHDRSFVWAGWDSDIQSKSHGAGSFTVNPAPANASVDPATGFYIGERSLAERLNEKANKADLATVATTGSYNDLSNKPPLGTAAALNVPSAAAASASTTEVVRGDDPRLSDARVPTSHTHSSIVNGDTTVSAVSGGTATIARQEPPTTKSNCVRVTMSDPGHGNIVISLRNTSEELNAIGSSWAQGSDLDQIEFSVEYEGSTYSASTIGGVIDGEGGKIVSTSLSWFDGCTFYPGGVDGTDFLGVFIFESVSPGGLRMIGDGNGEVCSTYTADVSDIVVKRVATTDDIEAHNTASDAHQALFNLHPIMAPLGDGVWRFDDANPGYVVENGVITPFPIDKTMIGYEYENRLGLSFVYSANVTGILPDAFGGCTSLSSVSFPVVKVINSYVFSGCTSLSSVSLPAATYIDHHAFRSCTSLSTMVLSSFTKAQILSNASGWDLVAPSGHTITITASDETFTITGA